MATFEEEEAKFLEDINTIETAIYGADMINAIVDALEIHHRLISEQMRTWLSLSDRVTALEAKIETGG